MEKVPDALKIEIGGNKQKNSKFKGNLLTFDFNVPLDRIERGLLRSIAGFLILFIVYCGFAKLIKNQIDEKNEEVQASIRNTKQQISLIEADKRNVQSKTNEYTMKISNLEEINARIEENNRIKKAIPNLLNRLMYIMPSGVQLTSIQNTNSTHIEIEAQSTSYSQLGYLAASIKTKQILTNVISTSGQKANNIITIKIEGDLP